MAYSRSAPESIRPGSIRPTSAPNAVDPPQLLGRSAPSFGSFRSDQTAPNVNEVGINDDTPWTIEVG